MYHNSDAENQIAGQNNRTAYFDYLRIFATFAVVVLHVSAQNWYSADVNGFYWHIFNFYDSIVRWSVPVFVMISGSIFLNKEIPIQRIYSKYIPRLIISYFVWSAIYYVLNENKTEIDMFTTIIQGNYHMWFIPMIVGLYMSIPFFRSIIKNEAVIKYYTILAFIFTFLLGTIVTILHDFGNEEVFHRVSEVHSFFSKINISSISGYSLYFILGYYLNNANFEKKKIILFSILGVMGFAATIILNSIITYKTQTVYGGYYSDFTVNVFFESVVVFIALKYSSIKENRIVRKIAQYCFGAYLIHALVIDKLNSIFDLNTLTYHPVVSVLCNSIIVFIISIGLSAILNQIPIIKKYMV